MQFQALKQELQTLFDKIHSSADAGNIPEIEDVKKFVRLCNQMQYNAPEEWALEADDFMHMASQLHQSVKNSHLEHIMPIIQSLEDAKNYCHRSFK